MTQLRFVALQSKKNGRTAMDLSLTQQKSPDAATPHDASDDLAKLICKLRWMGMDEEADRVAKELAQRQVDADSMYAAHSETD
jgi:hypothetical protein